MRLFFKTIVLLLTWIGIGVVPARAQGLNTSLHQAVCQLITLEHAANTTHLSKGIVLSTCTGTVINASFLLTAAHCFNDLNEQRTAAKTKGQDISIVIACNDAKELGSGEFLDWCAHKARMKGRISAVTATLAKI